jgi:hypothetical protein
MCPSFLQSPYWLLLVVSPESALDRPWTPLVEELELVELLEELDEDSD